MNTQLGGNDFALDDISLIPVLTSKDKEAPAMNTNPSADFTYFITNCNKVQFKITSNENIKSYKWDLGDKSTATKESFFHVYIFKWRLAPFLVIKHYTIRMLFCHPRYLQLKTDRLRE